MIQSTARRPSTYGSDASIAQFTVGQYQGMVQAGVLTDADRVELLENYVVLKMPRDPLHDGTITRCDRVLKAASPPGWLLRNQMAVVTPDSQPEPDLALARGLEDDYFTRHPDGSDLGLAVEVAESTLIRDKLDKSRIYATAGIPAYWIINLVDRRVEVHTRPTGTAYADTQQYAGGDIVPLKLDGVKVADIPVGDLLPPA